MCFRRGRDVRTGRGSLGIGADNLLAIVDVVVVAARRTRDAVHVHGGAFDENRLTIALHKHLELVMDERGYVHFTYLLEASLNNPNGDLDKTDGRIDLKVVFAEYLRPEEYYFGIECKRLKPGDADTFRYYVDNGVGKYADGTYSPGHPVAMLVGYLMAPFGNPAETQLSTRILRRYAGAAPLGVWPDLATPDATLVVGEVPRTQGAAIKLLHAMLPMYP